MTQLDEKTPRILIVEDSEDIADVLTDQLKAMGLGEVDITTNGLEGYNKCVRMAAEDKSYDLIISDFKMPKMTGLELLRKVRNNPLLDEARFVMITAFGEEHVVKESVTLRVDDFITKPFNQDTLARKIDAVFKRVRRR